MKVWADPGELGQLKSRQLLMKGEWAWLEEAKSKRGAGGSARCRGSAKGGREILEKLFDAKSPSLKTTSWMSAWDG